MIKSNEVAAKLAEVLSNDVNLIERTEIGSQILFRSAIERRIVISINFAEVEHFVIVTDEHGDFFRFMVTPEGAIGQSNSYKRGADMVLSRLMIETVMMVSIQLKQAVKSLGADPEEAFRALARR